MRRAFLVLFVLCVTGVPGGAQTPEAQVMAPIHKFMDSFNSGDVAGAAATHAADADLVIIDEVAPYLWRGAKAFQSWAGDLEADAKRQGIGNQKVTIGKQTRVEISGDEAYVIVPATYTFTQKEVPMRSTAQMTFALHKGPGGWLIHGWTWTGGRATKAAAKQ